MNIKKEILAKLKTPVSTEPYKLDEENKKALATATELTEEAGDKVATLFEAAVNAKIKEVIESLETKYQGAFKEQAESLRAEMVTNIEGYLEYFTDQWVKENAPAIKDVETAENNKKLVDAMAKTFAEHYIPVPSKAGVMRELTKKYNESKKANSDLLAENINLKNKFKGQQCLAAFKTLCEGLADTQVEKFRLLVEEFEIDNPQEFVKKATQIKEAFFANKVEKKEEAQPKKKPEVTEEKVTKHENVTVIGKAARLLAK